MYVCVSNGQQVSITINTRSNSIIIIIITVHLDLLPLICLPTGAPRFCRENDEPMPEVADAAYRPGIWLTMLPSSCVVLQLKFSCQFVRLQYMMHNKYTKCLQDMLSYTVPDFNTLTDINQIVSSGHGTGRTTVQCNYQPVVNLNLRS